MSTLEAKPIKEKKELNPTMLTVAAILLIVLALLFLASPLIQLNGGFQRGTNFPRQFTGQNGQGGGNGQPFFQGGQGGNGTQNPGGTNLPGRQFGTRTGLLRLGLLGGIGAIVIYGIALVASLAAVIGMLSVKRWGKVLGIVMGVIYLLLALVSFLPSLLFSRFGGSSNPLSLILNGLHLVLAIAVIVFASIPAKNAVAPATTVTPPATTA